MKRLGIIAAVVIASSALFFGCGDGGDEDSSVKVTGITITGDGITDNAVTIAVGGTLQLTATVAPANATNKTVTWSSSNEAVASVGENGLVTGIASGEAAITATAAGGGGITATVTVTVTAPALVESVVIKQDGIEVAEIALAVAGTATLTAEVSPSNTTAADRVVTWMSGDEAVVTVADGLITGVAEGAATITATTAGNKADGSPATASVAVTVTAPALVESVVIKQDGIEVTGPIALAVAGTVTLTAEVLPSNTTAADRVVTWTSDHEAVVTVDNDGVVTWAGEGTATITATTAGNKADGNPATATVTVEAQRAPGLVVFNQSATPDAATTTALPELNGNGRYVINNNNATAVFSSKQLPNEEWKDNLLVYLDTPITGDFTLDARLNITQFNGTAGDGAWSGAWIGAFNDPTMVDFAQAAVNSWGFVGARKVYSGEDRMLTTRTNNSGSGTAYSTNNLYNPNNWAYEYIYTISRSGTTYTIQVKNSKTGEVMAAGERTTASNYTESLQGTVYLGVMITNCEIEISNFKVTQGADVVYQQTPSDPGFTPVPLTAIELNVAGAISGAGVDYLNPLGAVPEGGIDVKATLTPVNTTDDIVWSIAAGSNATIDQTGHVTVTGIGEFTVTAASGGISDSFSFNIIADYDPVESVTVSGPTEVNVGSSITLEAAIAPLTAKNEVFWSSSDETKARVDPDTGLVTGVAVGAVTIKATSYDGENSAVPVVGEYSITVIAPKEGVIFSWNAAADEELETIEKEAVRTINGVPIIALANPANAVIEGTKGYSVVNGRFVIGSDSKEATTASTAPAGTLDLSAPFRITIVYASMNGTTFQVYLNNNTSSDANSPLGNNRIWNGTEKEDGDTIVIDVNPSLFVDNNSTLQTGFVSLRADSKTTALITSITIEYLSIE